MSQSLPSVLRVDSYHSKILPSFPLEHGTMSTPFPASFILTSCLQSKSFCPFLPNFIFSKSQNLKRYEMLFSHTNSSIYTTIFFLTSETSFSILFQRTFIGFKMAFLYILSKITQQALFEKP